MDSNNPLTESSYSEDEGQYGHGEGFDMPSPWEDRVFWENRNANQNHFYRTSSTFTSSSSNDADEEMKVEAEKEKEDDVEDIESIGDGVDDYQIMVCCGKDGKYHVSTSTENMDDEVLAQFSTSSTECEGKDIKQGSSPASIFRPEMKSEIKGEDAPPLALASTNSSEWGEMDANECVEGLEYSSSSGTVVSSLLSVVTILFVATILYMVATNVANSTKLVKTDIGIVEPNTMKDYSSFSHQEQDAATVAAVTEFEEHCNKRGLVDETFLGFLFHITNLIQNLTNLNIWKERAESVLMGSLPANWVEW